MIPLALPSTFPFDDPHLGYRITLMQPEDVRQVMRIEETAFPAPWPASAYRHELVKNDLATYLVLKEKRAAGQGRPSRLSLLAYGGFWLMVDQSHISTLATHLQWRGQGLGEWMLVALIDASCLRGAVDVTLEVRVSNHVAQSLYRKYGFALVGRRKRYYRDNNEDALIMTTPRVHTQVFQAQYRALRTALRHRLANQVPPFQQSELASG